MNKRRVILTGANRGLGRKTAEILLEKYGDNFIYIFTERMSNHDELYSSLKKINSSAEIEIIQLDITSKQSRNQFYQWYADKYKTVDVLFNNAGVYDKDDTGTRPSKKTAEFTLNVNFFCNNYQINFLLFILHLKHTATVEFTELLFPLVTEDGKIIEISSIAGIIQNQPEGARAILLDQTLTKERLYQLANDYINNAEDQTKDLIFSNFAYFTSKALLNAYVRFVATKYIKPNQSIFSVHPGWVKTDMGGEKAPLTPDYACPFLVNLVTEIPFGRHPLNGKMQFENKEMEF